MREIKFRVFAVSELGQPLNKFIYSDEFNFSVIKDYSSLRIFFNYLLDQEIECFNELQQYTGLKDKSGDHIYEGDIVKFTYYHPDLEDDIVLIEFKEGSFGYLENEDNEFTILSAWSKELMEVIGNIYQNPELLENNK